MQTFSSRAKVDVYQNMRFFKCPLKFKVQVIYDFQLPGMEEHVNQHETSLALNL